MFFLIEFKQKLVEHQENKEQIESYQVQELSKVKYLVLLREQELAEKSTAMKDMSQQLEKLRNEVSRLRRQEEQLSDLQVTITIKIALFFFIKSPLKKKNDKNKR